MPLSRVLLPLCGLLLALAVTAATAAAPPYGPGEVTVFGLSAPPSTTWDVQISRCTSFGGTLVPMVTEAVYTLVVNKIDSMGYRNIMSFMGGSSLLSPSTCTKNANSLDCIWYWDQGRYAGAANAVAFYKGNRDPRILLGAGMIGTTVSNHWRVFSNAERCPCGYRERYGAVIRDDDASPYWADTGSSSIYSYQPERTRSKYSLCASERSTTRTTTTTTKKPTTATTTTTTTTTKKPTTTTTTTTQKPTTTTTTTTTTTRTTTTTATPAPTTTTTATTTTTTPAPTTQTTTVRPTTTTTAEPSEDLRRLNWPLVVGLSVASVVVVVVLVVLLSLTSL